MKIVLLVEGNTEHRSLCNFLQRSLKGKVEPLPGIAAVNFKGFGNYIKECPIKASFHLKQPDVLGVIGLIDLEGPPHPPHCDTIEKKCATLREHLEEEVGSPNFRQHFAIHELEAWLLSDPGIFPAEVKKAVTRKVTQPEALNGPNKPSDLLKRLYREKLDRDYKKYTNGAELFAKLDPGHAARKCPALKALLDDLLHFAQAANA